MATLRVVVPKRFLLNEELFDEQNGCVVIRSWGLRHCVAIRRYTSIKLCRDKPATHAENGSIPMSPFSYLAFAARNPRCTASSRCFSSDGKDLTSLVPAIFAPSNSNSADRTSSCEAILHQTFVSPIQSRLKKGDVMILTELPTRQGAIPNGFLSSLPFKIIKRVLPVSSEADFFASSAKSGTSKEMSHFVLIGNITLVIQSSWIFFAAASFSGESTKRIFRFLNSVGCSPIPSLASLRLFSLDHAQPIVSSCHRYQVHRYRFC